MATELITNLGKGRNAAKDAVQHAREKLWDVPYPFFRLFLSGIWAQLHEVVDTVRAETGNVHLIGGFIDGRIHRRG